MAKITINPITSSLNIETAINDRLQQIEDAFNDDVLWRDGFSGESNEMNNDLDMNGYTILNAIAKDGVGNAISDYVEYAKEWAINPEDDPVSIAAGGDDLSTYSAYHWAQKAEVSETSAAASASSATASAAEAAASAAGAQAAIGDVVYVDVTDSPISPTESGKLYSVDTTSGSVVFNLPSIAGLTGAFSIAVKKVGADANTVTLNGNGTDVIDGAASLIISDDDGGYTLLADEDATPDEWTSMAWGATAGGGAIGDTIAAYGAVSQIGTDLTTAVQDVSQFLDVSAQTTTPFGLWVSPDETVILVNDASKIYKYTVATPGDLSTASYDSQSVDLTTGSLGTLRNVHPHLTAAGTRWLLGDSGLMRIWRTDSSGTYDVTTLTASVTSFFSTSSINAEFTGMHVREDGKCVYVCGGLNPDTVGEVFLSEDFTIEPNGGTFVGDILDVFAVNPSAEGIIWTNDGWQFGILDDSVGFAVYDTAERWRLSGATYNSYLSTAGVNASVWDGFVRGTRLYILGSSVNDGVYIMDMDESTVPALPDNTIRGSVAKASIEQVREGLEAEKYITPRELMNAFTDIDRQAVAFGHKAMGLNGIASSNNKSVAVGYEAGYGFNGTGETVAIGYRAMYNDSSADYNTAVGSETLGAGAASGFSGRFNIAVGWNAMHEVGGGCDYNVCIGSKAGFRLNSNGDGNVFLGRESGPQFTLATASNNVCLGVFGGYQLTTGAQNISVGFNAGANLTTGSRNVCLGPNAGPAPASGGVNDKLFIDNAATDTPLIGADFSAGTVTINGSLNVTGGTAMGGYTNDGTGTTIDFSATPMHGIAPTAASNPTYTFTAPVAGATVTIIGTNLGAAGTITWPATLKWVGGTEPTWTAAGTDKIVMSYDGTNYWASVDLNLS